MHAANTEGVDAELLKLVTRESEQDGTIEQWLATSRHLIEEGFLAEAKGALDASERLASSAVRHADVALLAARAGDDDRAKALALKAHAAITKPSSGAEELALCDLARTLERLGDVERAAEAFGRLSGDDQASCAEEVAIELAGIGRIDRAETWARLASPGAKAWLAVARALAKAGKKGPGREALGKGVRAAGQDTFRLAEAAELYALLGDGKEAARVARKVRERVFRDAEGADLARLVRASLAGKNQDGADEIARRLVGDELLHIRIEGAVLYLDHFPDKRRTAEELLDAIERDLPAWLENWSHIADACHATFARVRLKTGHVARAIEHAAAIEGRATRVWAFVVIARHCRNAGIERTTEIDAALSLARAAGD